ncbi:MAG: radical SAM family heme chaperone HemW [Candidatus Gracilibacteria bacterium]|nr:radical SAM family heme chaperone HemW [Candidatus Gracilibacteria bacterium]
MTPPSCMFFYIHIPFCRQKCLYCKFALTPRYDERKVQAYISALMREISAFFEENPTVAIETIYFGGGTPSILSPEQIGEIISVFRAQKGCVSVSEITMESNPEDITNEYLKVVSQLGINRLSLGIQTLNNESLHMVGRSDSNESIVRSLATIANSTMENVSIDLMAGLPCTVPGQIRDDLNMIFSYFVPRHVSIYMLENESYPENWKQHLPSEDTIRNEYMSGIEWLKAKGFNHYELSNFAIPGFESKHNQSYWNHSDYRGFGLSAASFIDGKRFVNHASFVRYYRGDKQEDETLNLDSLRIERIMFGLRTNGVCLNDLNNPCMIDRFITEGLLEIREDKVFPTSTGIFLIDHIMGELI